MKITRSNNWDIYDYIDHTEVIYFHSGGGNDKVLKFGINNSSYFEKSASLFKCHTLNFHD